jgi:hypothetical protein
VACHTERLALDIPTELVPLEELVRLHGDVLQRGNSLPGGAAPESSRSGPQARAEALELSSALRRRRRRRRVVVVARAYAVLSLVVS